MTLKTLAAKHSVTMTLSPRNRWAAVMTHSIHFSAKLAPANTCPVPCSSIWNRPWWVSVQIVVYAVRDPYVGDFGAGIDAASLPVCNIR